MHFDFAMVAVLAVAGVGFALVNLLVGRVLRPRLPNPEKGLTYECGEKPVGPAWININPRFYVVALAFVIFEVEIVLTLPVALVFRDQVFLGNGWLVLVELCTFVAVLAAGLVWIWVRRDLDWVGRGAERRHG